ncbi:hypothetical protein [Paenibacillus tengchongensis]|uniref:hypothetical protein n=1 Tax=Paenibacillus tengchongensis TaxID=2608684 RepID=UPI00124EC83A|nr:hypothetical protein [Paenibacillus tengchongensis]
MTALKTMIALEYSRFSLKRLPPAQRMLLPCLLFIVLVMAGMLLPSARVPQCTPFIYAVLLLWASAMGFPALHMLVFPGHSYRDWILTFPHSRLHLLYAKSIAFLKQFGNAALLLALAALTVYALSVATGRYDPVPAVELARLLAAYGLLLCALLPLLVVLGLAFSLLMSASKWWLPLVLPYTLLWMLPLVVIALNFIPDGLHVLDYYTMTPGHAALAALVLFLIGWPVCYALLPLIARHGFGSIGQNEAIHARMESNKEAAAAGKTIGPPAASSSPLFMLYRLEASRYRSWEQRKWVRILKAAAAFAFAGLFFLLSISPRILQPGYTLLFILPVVLGCLWTLGRTGGLERRQLSWWLGMPHKRSSLLWTSVAAVWVAVTRINAVFSLAAAAGIGAALGAGRTNAADAVLYGHWLLFTFAAYTLALTLVLCLLQIIYALMNSRLLTLLIFPLALLSSSQSILINKYLFPEDIAANPIPSWTLLAWVAGIGLPLAWSCVTAGAKYLHLGLRSAAAGGSGIKQA